MWCMRELKYMENVPVWIDHEESSEENNKKVDYIQSESEIKIRSDRKYALLEIHRSVGESSGRFIGHKIEDADQVHMHLKGQSNF